MINTVKIEMIPGKVITDMQVKLITSLSDVEAVNIIPAVQHEIEKADEVIFTYDTHESNYLTTLEGQKLPIEHCIIGTDGWKIINELADKALVSQKIYKNTFGYTGWDDLAFEQIDEVRLCGVCTDICVISNALILRAIYPNTKITIVASACAGSTPEAHNAALTVAKSCQIEVEYV